ncbi:MAG TPA: hypothetical protein PKG54_01595 [Phycisphaerae bacterium]|nr:hypothetical protein [Phycisphaerae bacterium]HOB73195.1 hypothetical protein [Phycisphaerae bacterium]HOJ55108.1 hypothetical protein [Phycisphaerae bacterium]HOL27926.1 hypothetical protein [Phycisphaerae bacterium]HPP21731.1 hypothetical protein [Phycisphaerae bacterium]
MRAIRAVIDDGKVTLLEPADLSGRHEVLIVVNDAEATTGDQEWGRILRDQKARPAFDEFLCAADGEIAAGKTEPLDPDRL